MAGNAGDLLICDQHVSGEMLSAWRDSLLPPAEMERIRAHAAGCAACQARLAGFEAVARALLQQREIEPDGRLLADLRARAAQARRRGRIHLLNRRDWRELGALASVAAVLLIAVYLLAAGPGRFFNPLGGITPTARSTVAPTATATPTTTPSFSPVVSVSTAWGPHAANASFTTRVDATHIFVAQSVTADGRTLLGDEITTSGSSTGESMPASAGIYDIATRRFTPIGVAGTSVYPPACCDTDGRFLIAEDSAAPGATCGVCNERIWSYDLTAGQLWKVATGITYGGILGSNLSHGMLLLNTQGNGIQVVNLATHAITPLSGIPSNPSQAVVSAFAWPYVVYGTYPGSTGTALRLRNLSTGQDIPLPAIDALYSSSMAASNASGSIPILLTGDTLFATVAVTDPTTGAVAYTTLYEMDAMTSPNARLQAIAVFKGDLNSDANGGARLPIGVNSRLIVLQGAVWDRAEHRFVSIGAPFYGLTGDYLITTTTSLMPRPLSATPPMVTIYDTSTLPVTTG